jgi:hypothetical protein
MSYDPLLQNLINKAVTSGNDFGPYRFYSPLDGYEYLMISSVNNAGNLDLYYLRNKPMYNTNVPGIEGPFPVKLLNTSSDDAYLSFDSNLDSAYYTSNRDGTWFNLVFENSVKVDSVNSTSDDKCPLILKQFMVFTSNRPGGSGGYDLYYSVFKKGKWSSPGNFGPGINTSSNEYRPVLGYHPDFTNHFMMFSSDRPGGKGGFDLYFTGVSFPK